MVCGNPGYHLSSHLGVVGGQRGHQGARAKCGQTDRIADIVIADDGADRAKCLQRVSSQRAGIRPGQQQRSHEGPMLGDADGTIAPCHRRGVEGTVGKLATGIKHGLNRRANVSKLLHGCQRTHRDCLRSRVTDDQALLDTGLHGRDNVINQGLRNEGTADTGALLAGLDGHLGDKGLDERLELSRPEGRIRSQNGRVQRVRL